MIFRLAKTIFRLWKMIFRLAKTIFRLWKMIFRLAKTIFRLGKMTFRLARIVFRLGKMAFGQGNGVAPARGMNGKRSASGSVSTLFHLLAQQRDVVHQHTQHHLFLLPLWGA